MNMPECGDSWWESGRALQSAGNCQVPWRRGLLGPCSCSILQVTELPGWSCSVCWLAFCWMVQPPGRGQAVLPVSAKWQTECCGHAVNMADFNSTWWRRQVISKMTEEVCRAKYSWMNKEACNLNFTSPSGSLTDPPRRVNPFTGQLSGPSGGWPWGEALSSWEMWRRCAQMQVCGEMLAGVVKLLSLPSPYLGDSSKGLTSFWSLSCASLLRQDHVDEGLVCIVKVTRRRGIQEAARSLVWLEHQEYLGKMRLLY